MEGVHESESSGFASFHLLPTLAGRMAPWLADDPEQEIVLGICRRAWSQNQLRRKLLANALAILGAAGIERAAAIGPVLFSAQWPEGSIRPVGRVDLLVEPASVRAAFDAFLTAGWKPLCTLLDTTTDQFSFAPESSCNLRVEESCTSTGVRCQIRILRFGLRTLFRFSRCNLAGLHPIRSPRNTPWWWRWEASSRTKWTGGSTHSRFVAVAASMGSCSRRF